MSTCHVEPGWPWQPSGSPLGKAVRRCASAPAAVSSATTVARAPPRSVSLNGLCGRASGKRRGGAA